MKKKEKNIIEQKQEVMWFFMEFLLAITVFIESKEYIPMLTWSRGPGPP